MQNQNDDNGGHSLAQYILLPIATVYLGIFLALSNHYISRPKIESLLATASISSTLASEFIIDFISNLTFTTYSIASALITDVSDHPLHLLQYYNLFWLTLFLSIIMYKNHNEQQHMSPLLIGKNGFMLILCYVDITYHYFAKSTLISLPVIFTGLYIINLILNANQQKFIKIMFEILGIKPPSPQKPKTKLLNNYQEAEWLSRNYPVTREELDQKIEEIQKKMEKVDNFKAIRSMKPLINQIDTKIVAKEKLREIATCIHISLLKRQQQQKEQVKNYFGGINKTIEGKTTHLLKTRTALSRKTFLNVNPPKTTQRSTMKTHKTKKLLVPPSKKMMKALKQQEQDRIIQSSDSNVHEDSAHNFVSSDNSSQEIVQQKKKSQCNWLFWIFPIKMFQCSKILSLVVNIALNLGFGFLLNYCQVVMISLKFGRYFQFCSALLLLPILPIATAKQYLNTMSLSSLMKFGLFGLFSTISVSRSKQNLILGGGGPSIGWNITLYFEYQTIIQIIILIIAFTFVLAGKRMHKTLLVVFLFAMIANIVIIYLSARNS